MPRAGGKWELSWLMNAKVVHEIEAEIDVNIRRGEW